MRLAYCTSNVSPYMAACWRELASRPGVDLHVVGWAPGQGQAPFTDEVMAGVDRTFIDKHDDDYAGKVRSALDAFKPDTVIVGGWGYPAYTRLAIEKYQNARYYMAMDTPFRDVLRQRAGRFRHGKYFKSLEGVIVTGERSFQLARVLGFPAHKIHRGVYGVDVAGLAPLYQRRLEEHGPWPKRFLCVGKANERKGTDILVDAYARYRRMVTDPWPLTYCGTGPQAELLDGQEGIDNRGFVQPTDLPDVVVQCSAFVLPARFDAWPLVVVESCAAGLPVVCSTDCGSLVELVREYYNGITFDVERPDHFARRMKWLHDHHDRLPEMGRRSLELAAPYSAFMWAERHLEWLAR